MSKMESYGEFCAKEYGESLYYYTSLSTLVSFINNQELWLTSVLEMNDAAEAINYLKNAEEVLNKKCNNHKKVKEELEAVKVHIFTQQLFAMCFSQNEDEASQWERYADNGRGVCIEFNCCNLSDLLRYCNLGLHKISYNNDLDNYKDINILAEYINNGKLEYFNRVGHLHENISAKAVMQKNSSFRFENEIRLMPEIFCSAINVQDDEAVIRGQISKIIKVPLKLLCEQQNYDFSCLINKILLGPRCKQDINELKEYFSKKGNQKISSKIDKTKCTLR